VGRLNHSNQKGENIMSFWSGLQSVFFPEYFRKKNQEEIARKSRESAEQIAQANRQHSEEIAKKAREHSVKLQYEKTFDIKGVPLTMVYIPAGSFQMGNNQWDWAKPVHPVEIKKAFYMGKYPVTQKQYQTIMGDNPSNWKGDHLPVESMYWKQAKEFCEKLSKLLKQDFRLPSEAQWEYACRAETTTNYWWGDNMDNNRCWYGDNSGSKTHPVNEKENTHGNGTKMCGIVIIRAHRATAAHGRKETPPHGCCAVVLGTTIPMIVVLLIVAATLLGATTGFVLLCFLSPQDS
jgi:hypothetical protein